MFAIETTTSTQRRAIIFERETGKHTHTGFAFEKDEVFLCCSDHAQCSSLHGYLFLKCSRYKLVGCSWTGDVCFLSHPHLVYMYSDSVRAVNVLIMQVK